MKRSKRDLLKAMTIGTGAVGVAKLPSTWTKPVVESVTLPAHAQTTAIPLGGARTLNLEIASGGSASFDSFANDPRERRGLLSTLVADAHAQPDSVPGRLKAYVEPLGNSKFLVQMLLRVQGVFSQNMTSRRRDDDGGGLLNSVVGVAHALVDVDLCYTEILWQKRLEVKPAENGKYKSDWYEDIMPVDWCGTLIFIGGEGVALRLRLDDGMSPTSGVVTLRGGEDNFDVDVEPGASKLKADCNGMPCEQAGSDRGIKEGFEQIREQEILDKLADLPLEYWNYADGGGVRHIGPMAQDFYATFNVGGSDRSINVVDANGVNMASIKALYRRLEEKDARIARLEDELRKIKDMLGLDS